IVLDLNLPKRNGFDVLREVRRQPWLTSIPVCILTSSEREEDVRMAYELGANCYVQKPTTFEPFVTVVRRMLEFWTMVRLPRDDTATESGDSGAFAAPPAKPSSSF